MVTSTLKSARKSSFKTSMLNLVKAADHYYADHQLDITSPIAFDFIKGGTSENGEELSFKGTKPKTGRVIINVDGEITLQDVSDGKYYANYNSDSDDDVMVTEDNQVLTRDELTDELKKLKQELADTKTELQTAINKKSNQSDMDKISTQLTSTTNLATLANNTVNELSTNVENNYASKNYVSSQLSSYIPIKYCNGEKNQCTITFPSTSRTAVCWVGPGTGGQAGVNSNTGIYYVGWHSPDGANKVAIKPIIDNINGLESISVSYNKVTFTGKYPTNLEVRCYNF